MFVEKEEIKENILEKKPHKTIEAFLTLRGLVNVKRAGFVKRGIEKEKCQSSAGHSAEMGRLAFIFGYVMNIMPDSLDKAKVIQMCLLHDTGEVKIGDYRPGEISKEEKDRIEMAAVEELYRGNFPYGNDEISIALIKEFIENKTQEAKYANQLDKLEAVFKAKQYEKAGNSAMVDFYDWTRPYIIDSELKKIFEHVVAL